MNHGKPLTRKKPLKRYREGPSAPRETHPRAEAAPKPAPAVKPKTCAWEKCGREFIPFLPMQKVCSGRCAKAWARADREAKEKAERAQDRARREAAKPRNKVKGEAQDAFNDYIRYRDRGLPCVSCGTENPPMTRAGQWDAGHFLSRGSHPELAFDEDNCHRQCKPCNAGGERFKHKERTVSAGYEDEILRRIGPDRLARLRGPHPAAKRAVDDFRHLRDTYRARLKALKASQ